MKPEIECFEPGHVLTALRLRDEGLLADPLQVRSHALGGEPLDQVNHAIPA